jgi:Cys-rich repeat protein
VRWRTVLAILASLLLPVPLVLLLGGVLRPALPEVGPGGKRISPVLTSEERARLMTYRRDCWSGQPCEPPLGCITELRYMRNICTDSQCSTDAQCPEGQVCRTIATSGGVPLVRYCVPVGVRQEGEPCYVLSGTREDACAPGLICGGFDDEWCAQPCQLGDAAACPAGFFCADAKPEPVCLPTCEARGCPEGQHCIRYEKGVSACAKVYGPQCQQTPCPRGGECEVWSIPEHPGKVWMECLERCGEGYPPCGAGLLCDGWQCRAPCDPKESHPCIEGYACKQERPHRLYACQPEWRTP